MEKTDLQYKNIKNASIKAVKWSYGYTVLPKLISPVITLFLARLLEPSIFGLIAIATLVISVVDTIREAGLSRAFVQSDYEERTLFNVVFWLSLAFGVGIYVIIFMSAPIIANFFHSKDATLIIQILGIRMILSSLTTSHRSILIRRIDFKKLFKINLLPSFTPLLVTLPLAYIGMGVWSLVIGHLSSSIIRTFLFWYILRWHPRFEFNLEVSKKIAYFGFSCSLEALLGWFYVWGDKAIVGHFLDLKQLGIYTIASNLVTAIFSVVFAPISNISYPALCHTKKDIAQLRRILFKLIQISALIAPPIGILINTLAYIMPTLIGEKWNEIVFPLGILAITASLSWIVTIIIPDAFRAIGRPDIMPKFQSAKLLYTLPAFIIGVTYGGLIGFCYAKLITVTIGFLLFIVISVRIIKIKYEDLFYYLKVPFLSVLIMVITLHLLKILMSRLEFNHIVMFFVLFFSGCTVYLALFIFLEKNLFKDTLKLGLQILKPKSENK